MRRTIVIALLIAVACKSQATKAEKARGELASWAATGQVMSSAWARGAAQTPYVKSTARTASDELEKLGEPLQGDPESTKSLAKVSTLYEQLSRAVEQHDRRSGAGIASAFTAINADLQQKKNASKS